MAEYKSRITGRVEKWWKNVCIEHNCEYYIHDDYPHPSYCTCPTNCILVNKSKEESEE